VRAVALLVALGLAPALLASATPAAAQVLPTAGPQVVIDGPSADIVSLDGLSVAHDGSGGIVYLKQVLGAPHVFVSRLADGTFQPPE